MFNLLLGLVGWLVGWSRREGTHYHPTLQQGVSIVTFSSQHIRNLSVILLLDYWTSINLDIGLHDWLGSRFPFQPDKKKKISTWTTATRRSQGEFQKHFVQTYEKEHCETDFKYFTWSIVCWRKWGWHASSQAKKMRKDQPINPSKIHVVSLGWWWGNYWSRSPSNTNIKMPLQNYLLISRC